MYIRRGDAEFFTVSFGAGPRTVLALGGWAGSWELWAGPFEILSRTWRTVAYDHRGAGATVAPVESISLETMAADVFTIMDALEIDRCVLAGESAGAAVVLHAAIMQPERFTGLVLVDALYHRPAPQAPDPFVLGLQANFEATVAWFVDACVPEPDSAVVRRWGRQILARSGQEAAIRLYQSMDGIDMRPVVGDIALPALIIHGEQDALVPLEAACSLAEAIPNSRLVVLPDTGHVPTVTRPAEVAAAIDEYFA
ncbi:MAG: alpha/beta hydrolase [Caldilineales bacterium]